MRELTEKIVIAVHLVPFAYTFCTRINTLYNLVAGVFLQEYFVVYFVATYALFGSNLSWERALEALWLVFLAYLLFYSVYEIGYAINDQVSAHLETNPTRRNVDNLKLTTFVASHCVWFLALLALLTTAYGISVWEPLAVSALLVGIELVHNLYAIRHSHFRLCTFSALRVVRYVYVLLVLAPATAWCALVVLLPALMKAISSYHNLHRGNDQMFLPIPFAVPYLAFLPVQLLILGLSRWPLILPNLMILGAFATISVFRRLVRKNGGDGKIVTSEVGSTGCLIMR